MAIPIRSPSEIDAVARAGSVVWQALTGALAHATPGVTTGSLDEIVRTRLRDAGADVLFEGYRHGSGPPFPAACCVCVNEQVTHGVPGDRVLAQGDLVTVDVGARLGGWCADAAASAVVGGGSRRASELLEVTRSIVDRAIGLVRPGRAWSEVVAMARSVVGERGWSLAAGYDGHGIGRELHEPPRAWLAWPGERETGADFVFRPGMVLTIEPIVLRGGGELVTMPDGWTVRTRDRSLACHEERTIGVTRHGCRVLTGTVGWPEAGSNPVGAG